MSFCFLYNVVSDNYSVQNSPWGGGGSIASSRSNNSKSRKTRKQFMCSARHHMVFNVCVKFHENMSSGFKVMEQTRKLLTHKGQ